MIIILSGVFVVPNICPWGKLRTDKDTENCIETVKN